MVVKENPDRNTQILFLCKILGQIKSTFQTDGTKNICFGKHLEVTVTLVLLIGKWPDLRVLQSVVVYAVVLDPC